LKGTAASTLVSEKIEKTAICIKSTLVTYIKSLRYVNDQGGDLFSIRQWIKNEKNKHWLFFTSQGNTHESMKPLLTAWLDIAVNELMSLPDSMERRIWVVLDELYSLQKVPYLQTFLSEAGKFGGCGVIGLQSYPQLEEVYGEKGARIISALLNTRFLFKEPDPSVAQWSAFNLGEAITEEIHEGVSYGANSMRDGISINKVETRKPLVSYSEIMSLAQLNAFVRLPGKYPITPVDFIPKNRQKINPGFILREDDEVLIKEVEELIEKSEQARIVLSEEELKQIYLEEKKKKDKKNKKEKKNKEEKQDKAELDTGHALDL
jgi:type IV secretory pathway TraG/TraD family ATPase VirD4